MTSAEAEALRQRAFNGDADAQMALARQFDREGRPDMALQWLQRAADGGHLPSLTALGARLLTGRGAPQMPSQGAQMVAAAADGGDAQACAIVAVLAAAGVSRPQSWSAGLDYLFRAARLGDSRSRLQIAILVNDRALAQRVLEATDDEGVWQEARAAIDLSGWFRRPTAVELSAQPRIEVISELIPPTICEWIVALARARIHVARAQSSAQSSTQSGDRSAPFDGNVGVRLGVMESDFLLQLVNARVAAATGQPVDHQEPIDIANFAPGQGYGPQADYIDPSRPLAADQLRSPGQRLITVLIGLSEAHKEGQIEFPAAGVGWQSRAGDAVLIHNVDAHGAIEPDAVHAALPPKDGEMWLMCKWVRDRPYPQF